MKRKIYIATSILIVSANALFSQPLPPSTPNGTPVPINGLFALLPIAFVVFGYLKLRKKGK